MMRLLLSQLWCNQKGASAIEYALIGAVVCVVMLIGFQYVGDSKGNMFDYISNSISNTVEDAEE